MNAVMSMPSFCMRLCSPTSTSKQIEVAMKFSGQHGIVLQMDNPNISQYKYLHGFNASWISRFKTEDERLFFGGLWAIKIESIRIRSTKQNFKIIIHCLVYLDTFLSGGKMYDMEVTEDEVFILECLMNGFLNPNETEKRFDDYIYSTFDVFTRSKKQIVLDLGQLRHNARDNASKKLLNLLMNPLDKRDVEKEEEVKRECDDLSNLWEPQIFEIFKNVKS
eukprot:21530_1